MSGEDAFLDGGGDMAAAIRDHDWNATSLGPIAGWPVALKIAVGMMVNSRFPKCIVWGADLITIHNDAFGAILGDKPCALGHSFRDVWAEVWDDIGPLVHRALAGEATFIEDFPLTIDRYGHPEEAWFTFCYSPIRDETGEIAGVMDTVIETTARVESQRRMEALNSELAHRIRNTLAIVGSIASQTLKTQSSTAAAAEAFSARLRALAGTHNLLTTGGAVEAQVGHLVRETLFPHLGEGRRVGLVGPKILLPERQALALALAVNELATNALKHGALSTPEGFVDIAWATSEEGEFVFSWTERGGPSVAVPQRVSFGMTLLQTIVPMDFRGSAHLAFEPTGFAYRLRGRIERLDGEEKP